MSCFHQIIQTPQEFEGDWVDEAVDTWAIGHNIYGLLTGLWPFYTVYDDREIRRRVQAGKLPYVDPRYRTRSYIEGRLVEAMEMVWGYHPADRATIFEVVEHLRETKRVATSRRRNKY